MAKTLKEIDKDILERIKKIHKLNAQWHYISKAESDAGKIDKAFSENTSRIWAKIELEIREIYKDVMTQEEIDKHIMALNEEMQKKFGYKTS